MKIDRKMGMDNLSEIMKEVVTFFIYGVRADSVAVSQKNLIALSCFQE